MNYAGPPPTPKQQAVRAIVFLIVYAVAGKIGLELVTLSTQISPAWPASGVVLAAAVLFGWRAAPFALIAIYVLNRGGAEPLPAFLMALGNVAEAYLGRFLLGKMSFSAGLQRLRDVLAIGTVALVAPSVSAVIGASSVALGGHVPWSMVPGAVLVWWVGNAMGILVVAPVMLSLYRGEWRRPSFGRVAEAFALAVALVVVGGVVFTNTGGPRTALFTQAFLPFPLALWAAIRFGVRGAALTSLALAAAAVGGTAAGLGPFVHPLRLEGVILVQVFIAVVSLSSLVLAAVTTERTRASAHAELLSSALRHTEEGVLIIDPDPMPYGRIVFVNEGFSKLSGYAPHDLEGVEPRVLFGPSGRPPEMEPQFLALWAGESLRSDVVLVRKNREPFEVEVQIDPVRDEQGRLWFVSTHRDTTERRRTQARLLLSERMASLGQLAAAMAHEINNPLTFTMANLQFAEREVLSLPRSELARISKLRDAIDHALDGAERVRRIVRDLRLFTRADEEQRAAVEPNAGIERALTLAANELRHRARLVRDLGATPRVEAIEARLVQLWVNLLVNAAQAIPAGAADRHEIRVRSGTHTDGRARIEVSDSGEGIAPEALSRVFEPFFTTKEGQGTGLGLAISKQIVEEHGGEIIARSEPGEGTTLTVLLPAATVPPSQPEAEAPVVPGRRAKVLVIDDEVRIGQSMKMLLEPDHEVTATTNGREAVEWLAAGLTFDVIFCDLQMPQSSGMEIHAELKRSNPEAAARMVFVSGGAFTAAAREFLEKVENPVLEKPVRPEVLLATIGRAIEAAAQRDAE